MKITKRKLQRIIKEELEGLQASPLWADVEFESLEVSGVDYSDYPDFVDAFLSYGRYTNGTEMTDEELEAWQNDNPDLFYDALQDSLH